MRFLEAVKYLLDKLFPDGMGTKAIIAATVIIIGLPMLEPGEVGKVVMLTVTGWLVIKANGKKPAPPNGGA